MNSQESDNRQESDIARRKLIAQLESDQEFGILDVRMAETHGESVTNVKKKKPEAPRPAKKTAGRASKRVAQLSELLGPPDRRSLMDELDREVASCENCKLHSTRTLAVPGEGNVDADLMFVGEGPGADEDASGRPFVGRAGALLSKIIVAMGFTRESVYIANIVKCRPPKNRDPQPDETTSCFPYLERQIEIIQPKVICTLGLPATRLLLKNDGAISSVRGKKFLFQGTPLVPTYHPAYLLRNPAGKGKVWEDVQFVARLVEEAGGTIPNRDVLESARSPRRSEN